MHSQILSSHQFTEPIMFFHGAHLQEAYYCNGAMSRRYIQIGSLTMLEQPTCPLLMALMSWRRCDDGIMMNYLLELVFTSSESRHHCLKVCSKHIVYAKTEVIRILWRLRSLQCRLSLARGKTQLSQKHISILRDRTALFLKMNKLAVML